MPMLRLRFTVRRMMAIVAVIAVLHVTWRARLNSLGPRDGMYYGSYGYLGDDWKWHEVPGTVITVQGGRVAGAKPARACPRSSVSRGTLAPLALPRPPPENRGQPPVAQ